MLALQRVVLIAVIGTSILDLDGHMSTVTIVIRCRVAEDLKKTRRET